MKMLKLVKFVFTKCAIIAKKIKSKYFNTSSEITMCIHLIYIDKIRKIIALPSLTHFDMHFITYIPFVFQDYSIK